MEQDSLAIADVASDAVEQFRVTYATQDPQIADYVDGFTKGVSYVRDHYRVHPTAIKLQDQTGLETKYDHYKTNPNNGEIYLAERAIRSAIHLDPSATISVLPPDMTSWEVAFVQGVEAAAEHYALFQHPQLSGELRERRQAFNQYILFGDDNPDHGERVYVNVLPVVKVQQQLAAEAMASIGLVQDGVNQREQAQQAASGTGKNADANGTRRKRESEIVPS